MAGLENMEKEIKSQIAEHIDEGYGAFHRRLVPGTRYEIRGVRVPILRKISKKLAEIEKIDALIEYQRDEFKRSVPTYELMMVHLLMIAYSKGSPKEKLRRARPSFLLIDNWAHCDTFATTFSKDFIKSEEGCGVIPALAVSSNPWESRIGLVMSLSLPEQYQRGFLEFLHNRHDEIPFEHEAVSMALAWVLSQYYFSCHERTTQLLENWPFDEVTLKRAMQKVRESRRKLSK